MSEHSIGKPCRKFVNPDRGDPHTFSIERPVQNYDWTLISSDDVKFRIHSSVLVSHSDYFAALCASGMSEQRSNTVEFSDIDSVALERFLSYVCTGSVIVGADSFLSLVQLGCRFQCQSLTEILRSYLESEFLNIPQSDISELLTTRVHPTMADICRKLTEKHLIRENMLGLSFEAVAGMLRRDDLESSCEDQVLKFVENYCERWELDKGRRLELLDTIRQPRLTCAAFERAAIFLSDFNKTSSFETIANSKSLRYEFIDKVDEEQLRPRAGNDVHITALWIIRNKFQPTLLQDMPNGIVTSVRSLCVKAKSGLQTVTSGDFQFQDRKFMGEEDIFASGAFVTYANHIYCLHYPLGFDKITFRKRGPVRQPTLGLTDGSEGFEGVRRYIGVDVHRDSFFLSCQMYPGSRRISAFNCRIMEDDCLEVKQLELPMTVQQLHAERMIYGEDFICTLTSNANVVIYAAENDSLNDLTPADSYIPKYLQIARRGNKLYVFDYSECPVHLHDFSQPFSHFDTIRVYDLAQKKWHAHYPVDMNKLRRSGYNELIRFKIDMYFIREQLYFLWTYQDRLHIFRLDEEAGCTEHLFNYEIPTGANGVILLPGYFNLHSDSTVLERFMNSYCLQNLEFVGNDREKARKVAELGEKYFDDIVGSGLFPSDVDT